MTHGYRRAEILSTNCNGATLLVLALLIPYESITGFKRADGHRVADHRRDHAQCLYGC